jgi:hypothetical protein
VDCSAKDEMMNRKDREIIARELVLASKDLMASDYEVGEKVYYLGHPGFIVRNHGNGQYNVKFLNEDIGQMRAVDYVNQNTLKPRSSTNRKVDDLLKRYKFRYSFDKWKKMPKGWTDESRKEYWNTMTGDVKHKVTKCIKEMTGKVGDAGAFCASLADRVEGKGWRSEKRKGSMKIAVTWKEFLDEVDYFQVDMAEGSLGRLKNKKLRHPKMIERAVESFDRPDAGYDKVFFHIHMKDGQVLKGFRYDHGLKDPRFRDQLAAYIKRLKKS